MDYVKKSKDGHKFNRLLHMFTEKTQFTKVHISNCNKHIKYV